MHPIVCRSLCTPAIQGQLGVVIGVSRPEQTCADQYATGALSTTDASRHVSFLPCSPATSRLRHLPSKPAGLVNAVHIIMAGSIDLHLTCSPGAHDLLDPRGCFHTSILLYLMTTWMWGHQDQKCTSICTTHLQPCCGLGAYDSLNQECCSHQVSELACCWPGGCEGSLVRTPCGHQRGKVQAQIEVQSIVATRHRGSLERTPCIPTNCAGKATASQSVSQSASSQSTIQEWAFL
jgi:hypothetical protein